jgi:5'-methylthioadenosine/S-adenosylhomocysteine nucleosidase
VIAVLGALPQEIRGLFDGLAAAKRQVWAGRGLHLGSILGRRVIAGHTGVGKSLAAMTSQHVIDTYAPAVLVFVGIAGSLNPTYEVGDIVIAEDAVQHDMDTTMFGFRRGEIPNEKIRAVESDQRLVDSATKWQPEGRRVFRGRILTGDQFISDDTLREYLRSELKGDAVDMEGASAGLVARLNAVPFLLVRVISDKADGKTPPDFQRFLADSSTVFLDLIEHLISDDSLP